MGFKCSGCNFLDRVGVRSLNRASPQAWRCLSVLAMNLPDQPVPCQKTPRALDGIRLERVSRTAHAGFVLDALEQALHERRPVHGGGLVHHSDRGSQYLSIRYTERLADAGVEPSVGSVGDSYDNALAETINGLYKAESSIGEDPGGHSRRSN